ncbi:hypothetical protein ACFVIM_17145 [Streptomyces sp. NPDC057638]|uniref:hypothetical protein n=1 Tax=Streptomyces sp. NPDC057638 TaxID=3346190 RepID=UPI0036BB135B
MQRMTSARGAALALGTCLALATLGGTAAAAPSVPVPAVPAAPSADELTQARNAATAPATMDTLSRFFARDGAVARSAAAPRADGRTVAVLTLSPEFVAGKKGAPVARVDVLATPAVSSDGQKASVWAARQGTRWQVVNIATGDDEFRYATLGARKLPGGTVFREPQIDAWYVTKGTRVLPLDDDATRAIGAKGTTLAVYGDRVRASYADKLPGSEYAKEGYAGGFDAAAPAPAPAGGASDGAAMASGSPAADTATAVAAGAGVVVTAALGALALTRLRRRA